MAQRLAVHMDNAIQGKVFRNLKNMEYATNISKRFLTECQDTKVQFTNQGLGFGAMVAAFADGAPRLIEYATTNFQPELKQGRLFFVSMGSGQLLADPFLAFVARVLWKNQMPTVEYGKFGVYWALNHTITHAPGGVGGPIHIAVLRNDGEQWIAEELPDTQEQGQYVTELENHIGGFAWAPIAEATAEPIPAAPVGSAPVAAGPVAGE